MSINYGKLLRMNVPRYYHFIYSSVRRATTLHSLRSCLTRKSYLNVSDCHPSTPSNYRAIRGMCSASVKNIDINDYLQMREDLRTTIIDVREKSEIAETGILPGAINIPLGDVSAALQQVPSSFEKMYNKSKPSETDTIIFSCRSGKRSMMAAESATKLGYEKVLNLAGGWLAWEEYSTKQPKQ